MYIVYMYIIWTNYIGLTCKWWLSSGIPLKLSLIQIDELRYLFF